MREGWEKFSQMELPTWLAVMAVSIAATVVRFLIEARQFTLQGFIASSFMAGFVAYISALYCLEVDATERMTVAIIGVLAYQSTNILTGIGKLGAAFASDPIALLKRVKGGKNE